jgi:hypothetical protein
MAFRKKGKFAFKKRSYAKRRPKRVLRKKVSPLRQMVKMEIARSSETKSVQAYSLNRPLLSSVDGNFIFQNQLALGPNTALPIPTGTTNSTRVGNKVTTKSLTLRGNIVPLPYSGSNPTPSPVDVVMYVYYDRVAPSQQPNPKLNDAAFFFQYGSANRDFSNDLVDETFPINTDRYRILAKKVIKVGYAYYGGTGSDLGAQQNANNDYDLNAKFSFNLTKHYPKVVTWDDNVNGTNPTSRGLYILFVPLAAGGGSIPASYQTVSMSYVMDYRYDDN